VNDDLSAADEGADPRDAGDIAAVPFHTKLEILVGVESLRVDGKHDHETASASLSRRRSDGRDCGTRFMEEGMGF
jgi:hypothetical protein